MRIDLARYLIKLSGHRRSKIEINFSGLRPGEKLYEELLADEDHALPSQHPRLRIARLQVQQREDWLEALLGCLRSEPVDVRTTLLRFVPEYGSGTALN